MKSKKSKTAQDYRFHDTDLRVSFLFVCFVALCYFFFQPDVEQKLFVSIPNTVSKEENIETNNEKPKGTGYLNDMEMQPRGPSNGQSNQQESEVHPFVQTYKEAMAMKNSGNMKSFVSLAKKALKIEGSKAQGFIIPRAELLFELAVYQKEKGKNESAEKLYMKIIKMGRVRQDIDQAARFNYGILLTNKGKFYEAIPILKEVLVIAERTDTAKLASHNLGTVLRAVGSLEEAMFYFEHALSIEPDALPPLKELIQALRLAGRMREAEEKERYLCQLDSMACPQNKQKFFVVGERNSGTNWLGSLLTVNFPTQLYPVPPEINGVPWKHASFDNSDLVGWKEMHETLIVGLTKDPFAWFWSMHKRPWHATHAEVLKAKPLTEAVLLPWDGTHYTEDGRVLTESYANMAELRTAKLRGLKKLSKKMPDRVLICKYEDLLNEVEAERILTSFFQKHGIKFDRSRWESISFPIHGNQHLPYDASDEDDLRYEQVNRDRHHFYSERKYMELIIDDANNEELCSILEALDPELERWAGYDIEEDMEQFC